MSYVSREQIYALQIAMDEYATAGQRAARQEEYYHHRVAALRARREERLRQAARMVLVAIVIFALVAFALVLSDAARTHNNSAAPGSAQPGLETGGSGTSQIVPQTSATGATGWRDSRNLREAARAIAVDERVPPRLLAALIGTESSWRVAALGSRGEVGLAQLRPSTAAALGVDASDPHQNMRGAARYLRGHYDRLGNWALALERYNGRGPRARAYAQRVLRAWEAGE